MDQTDVQSGKNANGETSRTRRSLLDGNVFGEESNSDDEGLLAGFYVREKTVQKISEPPSKSEEHIADIPKDNDSDTKSTTVLPNGDCLKHEIEQTTLTEPLEKTNGEIVQECKTNELSEAVSEADISTDCVVKQDEARNGLLESEEPQKDPFPTNSLISTNENNQKEEVESHEANTRVIKDSQDETASQNLRENETEKAQAPVENEKKLEELTETSSIKATEEVKETLVENEEKLETLPETSSSKATEDAKKTPVDSDRIQEADETKPETNVTKAQLNHSNVEKISNIEETDSADEVKEIVPKDSNKPSDLETDLKSDKEETSTDQLEKIDHDDTEGNVDPDSEMYEDFDPSLLCPDISMDVDEAPVVTNPEGQSREELSSSPLPYEPIFSTLVDEITGAEVQIDLTPAEIKLRQELFGPDKPVQKGKIHCTACNVHLGSAISGANYRFVHPLLKVLICKNCYHFYTSGEFEKDEDGSELYCRWCGQGGQVLCCSSCEYVFCKRCIRNNFGQKRFKEIRDRDDWNCFLCQPEQLSILRATCAEFMDYYRNEFTRIQPLVNKHPELITRDYSTCCSGSTDKKEETKVPVTRTKRKRREGVVDPDYKPTIEEGEPPQKKQMVAAPVSSSYSVIASTALRPLVPKPVFTSIRSQASGPITSFKIGNTTFKAKPQFAVQTSVGNQGQQIRMPVITLQSQSGVSTSTSGILTLPSSSVSKTIPGYIKIIPPKGQFTMATNNKSVPSKPQARHEWFDKTVRGAARVNSNLSYTLSQLNKQQYEASTVEGLAVVHNKLQEVLSQSINSLIQIRKNLRNEFISGIKNIRLGTTLPPPLSAIGTSSVATPAATTNAPIVVKDDDDVIIVTPAPPPPPPSYSKQPVKSKSPPLVGTPKKTKNSEKVNPFCKLIATKPAVSSAAQPPKGFLKVRSLTSLQSVPSECITIPDDAPLETIMIDDPLNIDELMPMTNNGIVPEAAENGCHKTVVEEQHFVYNIKSEPTDAVKKMLNVVVMVPRSQEIEKLLKSSLKPEKD